MKETLANIKHKEFLESLVAGDRPSCSEYVHKYLKQNHTTIYIINLILKALKHL